MNNMTMDILEKVPHMCTYCPFNTSWNFSWQNHIKYCHVERRFDLFDCCSAFVEKFKCPDWDYATHLRVDYNNHMRRGHKWDTLEFPDEGYDEGEKQQLKCGKCNFATFSVFLYNSHKRKCVKKRRMPLLLIKTEVDESFEDEKAMEQKPNRLNVKEEYFYCDHCHFRTSNEELFKKHWHDKNLFYCHFCIFGAKDRPELNSHINSRHASVEQIKWFYCDICPYKSKRKDHTERHTLGRHNKNFACTKCSFRTAERDVIKDHLNTHLHQNAKKVTLLSCAYCSFTSKILGFLQNHVKQVHKKSNFKNKPYIPPKSPKTPKTPKIPKTHNTAKTPKSPKTHNTPKMPKIAKTPKIPKTPKMPKVSKLSSEMPANKFKCNQCPFIAKKEVHLKFHINYKHKFQVRAKDSKNLKKSDNGKYICDECGFQATTAYHLNCHKNFKHYAQRVINPTKINPRKINPTKINPTKRVVRKTAKVQEIGDDFRKFACEFCSYKGATSMCVKRHIINRHTPDDQIEWFNCDKCDYKAKRKDHLQLHVMKYHEFKVKEFSCAICAHKAKSKRDLRNHVFSVHVCSAQTPIPNGDTPSPKNR